MRIAEPSSIGAYPSVYLSPHLDDAALSCPGSILAERASGRRALLVTLFSETGDPHRLREEEHAASELGVDFHLAGLSDAPVRSAIYRSFNGIVFGCDPGDALTLDRLGATLSRLVALAQPEIVYAPLGVGGHIDHRLTCQAARQAIPHGRLVFYEDRPYAFVRQAVRLRLAELGVAPGSRPSRTAVSLCFFSSFFTAPYVRRYLHGLKSRSQCLARYWKSFEALGRPPSAEARPQLRCFERDTLKDARRAVSAYASQLPDLFGDLEGFERAAIDYSTRLGHPQGYVERCWKVDTPIYAG